MMRLQLCSTLLLRLLLPSSSLPVGRVISQQCYLLAVSSSALAIDSLLEHDLLYQVSEK